MSFSCILSFFRAKPKNGAKYSNLKFGRDSNLVPRLFCRQVVPLPPFKVLFVFLLVRNRFLFSARPSRRRARHRQRQHRRAGRHPTFEMRGQAIRSRDHLCINNGFFLLHLAGQVRLRRPTNITVLKSSVIILKMF